MAQCNATWVCYFVTNSTLGLEFLSNGGGLSPLPAAASVPRWFSPASQTWTSSNVCVSAPTGIWPSKIPAHRARRLAGPRQLHRFGEADRTICLTNHEVRLGWQRASARLVGRRQGEQNDAQDALTAWATDGGSFNEPTMSPVRSADRMPSTTKLSRSDGRDGQLMKSFHRLRYRSRS